MTTRFEQTASLVLIASLGIVTFNLLAAQVLFGIAALMWLRLILTDRAATPLPAFVWPLAGYVLLTIVSAALAFNRHRATNWDAAVSSLVDLKQLVLFLMVPVAMRLARGTRAMTALNVIIATGAAAALLGVVEYAMFGYDSLQNRPVGSLSHYMTYSGVIMIVLCAAVARLLFHGEQVLWPAVAIPALAVALGATQTRGVWIGALVGLGCLLAVRRLRLLAIVPVLLVVAFIVAPGAIRERAYSIVDVQDESNRDRIQMIAMGADMVRDHPWFGVGPEMVGVVYGRYLRPNPLHTYNPHLHNVPMQIAAERGLPALAAWLVFVGLAAAGLVVQIRRGPARPLAAAALAAIAAMCAAGLFEYNFGDSEFLMLFLGLITLPYAARLGADEAVR